jgi:hypothetical protein
MNIAATATWMLEQEARALLTRLARVRPFALQFPQVVAAAISPQAQEAIELYLARGRRDLRRMVFSYLSWLRGPFGKSATPAVVQSRFTFLRIRFNAVLSQFDIFADVLAQRSQHEFGIWISGLDAVASDSLALPGVYDPPPVVCYLARGHGAAIRRARTRLPGGGQNPVAIVRVPRERMVGSGIASSLVHEVGHQAAALLGLVDSFRPVLQGMQRKGGAERASWTLWERWISEILADFWSLARVGVAATMGLIGVVSLPRAFVFRIQMDDPHPFPWVRVKLSCAMGRALFPHPQWEILSRLWEGYYPRTGLNDEAQETVAGLLASMPGFVALLTTHRPKALRGKSLAEALKVADRQPSRLAAYFDIWRREPGRIQKAPPSLAFAVIGQARADGKITPEEESDLFAKLLNHWALLSTFPFSAGRPRERPACSCSHRAAASRQPSHSLSRYRTVETADVAERI